MDLSRRRSGLRGSANGSSSRRQAATFHDGRRPSAKAGDGGRLFGSVGAAEIVDAVDAQAGVTIDRRSLDLDTPIKDLGEHTVMCTLHPEVAFPVSVSVIEE